MQLSKICTSAIKQNIHKCNEAKHTQVQLSKAYTCAMKQNIHKCNEAKHTQVQLSIYRFSGFTERLFVLTIVLADVMLVVIVKVFNNFFGHSLDIHKCNEANRTQV